MHIIDAHLHLGTCDIFDVEVRADDLLRVLTEQGVMCGLVMPFAGAPDPVAVHDEIAELAASSGLVRGIVNLSPHIPAASYTAEAERCVHDLGFVGLKLHTVGHAVDPMSRHGALVFHEARRLGVPVIVHTGGVGEPFASPSHCLPVARAFEDVKIVLAHAGMGVATREAGIVAKECPNVWLETSWCSVLDLRWLLDYVGPTKMMVGSDSLENLPIELAKYRSLRLDEPTLDRLLSGTAEDVFSL